MLVVLRLSPAGADITLPPPVLPVVPRGIVSGKLVDQDGAPVANTSMALILQLLRTETTLGQATTGTDGTYSISYDRTPQSMTLVVTASDANKKVLATSPPQFAAPAQLEIDLTTAADGVVRSTSLFTTLSASATSALNTTPLQDLKQDKATQEFTFLAKSIGVPSDQVAYLSIAHALALKNNLRDETLFGLFVQGVPPTLKAALGSLPDAGVDDAFTAQVLSGVLAHDHATLDRMLTTAVASNLVPASYAAVQEAQLSLLDALRVTSLGSAPYIRGKTGLNDLLAAGAVSQTIQTTFVQTYAASGGKLGPTWKALRANKALAAADLTTLNTVLSAGELLSGNLPMVKDTLSRISQKTLTGLRDLALLNQTDWETRITAIDPTATSIPQVLPNDTPADRIARFAKALAKRFAGRYPTTALVGGLTKATTSSFTTKAELITFLTANPTLSFRSTNIDQFIVKNKLTISPAALAELKTVQRLHRLSPHYASVEPLHTAGYKSAQSVYFKGREPFLAQMTTALGSPALARTAYARAQMTYATALMAFGKYNLARNGVAVGASSTAPPDPTTLANLPDLQALFGPLDWVQCADCQSVYSPAAYLVDLLQYLSWFKATPMPGITLPPSTSPTAREALFLRRPDIQYVALDCTNTNVTIPYIDLVNEILEAAIAPTSIARPTVLETAGTTAQRRALPQQTQPLVSAAAYSATNTTVFPLTLPFDLSFAESTAFISALGTTRAAILALFPNTSSPVSIACAAIGINPATQAIINQPNTTAPWTRWGLVQNPAQVIDPRTNLPYSPKPADWVATLNKVPVLLNRSGLSLQQLYQLFEVTWVTHSAVTLRAGTTTIAGIPVLSGNTDDMVITGLDSNALDLANRFLRLWNASGLQMWELDWALEHATFGVLNDAFLTFLAGAMSVQNQLKLPFQEVLTFWSAIETRDVVSHLGDEDTVIPSTYSEVFANPTVLASWSALFGNPASLSGAQIVFPASANPGAAALGPLNGISAALGLSSAEISAILAASGAANALTLPTLTALFRYARLASSLSLKVLDLILWISLTEASPFGGSPTNTLEFLRRLAVLQGTTIAVHDLDYLLRGQSVAQSALAFTGTQATAVLQTIRDAVAKAISASQLTLTSVSGISLITMVTAKPHGLATGAEVFITGVGGNTAANGIFTITVTTLTSFTLNGSTGIGAWTGGGTATANLDATVQTIVVAALVTATGATADVVTPILGRTAVLPLNAQTIGLLLAAQPSVAPTQFPALIAALARVANAVSLYSELAPSPAAFGFAVQNATTFGWLDPSALPLSPITASHYILFEALLRALKLQQRLAARTPKLFDLLTQWMLPGQLPTDIPTAIGGPTILVANATNTTMIAITTTTPHNLQTGAQVAISLVTGNTAANGTFTITVTGPESFTLDGSIGNGAWVSGGVVTSVGTPNLAQALNAGIADVSAIATALAVKPPSLDPTHQAGTLADIATLTAIANALDVVARYGISGATLVLMAATAPTADGAAAAMGALQAQYPQSAWLAAVQPVEDNLRQTRRDALVAYLLGPGPVASPGAQFLTTDDIFNYYLIDPEMCACGETTRLLQPSLAIQQFVQQCFLNLNIGATVDTTDSRWSEWSWRQQYRLWQANREVFLYPENYVLPELRTNASSFFTDLENDLRQSNCDADAVETAFESYLRKLVGVSRLVVAAHYNQTNPDGSMVLHVFAHSRGTPPQWYYRTRTSQAGAAGTWSPWVTLNLDIASIHVLPVIWDRRLHLVWPVFHEQSEKAQDQSIPAQGGNSQSAKAAQKYWSVEFAISELSAGQWQAKRTVSERMYLDKRAVEFGIFNVDRPPQAFTFKASQDNAFNLQIQIYYNPSASFMWGSGGGINPVGPPLRLDMRAPATSLIGVGTMSMPDAPMQVVLDPKFLPDVSLVDLSQEPSYPQMIQQSQTGTLAVPNNYGFSGQDLIAGYYFQPTTVPVVLNVLSQSTAGGQVANVTLLNNIVNPRIVIPQQEAVFDSLDPFFVNDATHTYLVQPEYYTVSSSPQELDNLAYIKQWTTRFAFETFYHPYARTFLRELEVGGISQLMSRNLQLNVQSVRGWTAQFNFQALYTPQTPVATPYPGAPGAPDPGETSLDFIVGSAGAYSEYNWELFYHAPMFVASLLMQNQQYQDAMTWLQYIFNPTDNSGGAVPQRYWEMAPFYTMNASAWANEEIQNLLSTLAADTQKNNSDRVTTNAILAWMNDPYDPHMVASTRISAYGKATVMKFLDNLIAWGDSLYAQYTAETVSQAEQLYILADMILGPAPNNVRLTSSQQSAPPTYASLKDIDPFSNVLVNVENVILAPEPPQSIVQGTGSTPSLPQFPGNNSTLLFCIPPNDQLLAYWGNVAQRLYNIRHCLNLQGVPQPLPLYAPPINPLQLIAAKASGASSFGAAAAAPIYRFNSYMQKAIELANDVRAYGGLILSALEKQDAETLAALRANQELDIQTRMLDVKNQQVTEAQDQITSIQNRKAVTQIRYNFYSSIAFMNTCETTAVSLQGAALIANGVAVVLDMTAGAAHLFPKLSGGANGFGGTPQVTVGYGGDNIGHSATAWSDVARGLATILSESGGMASTMGSYQRRQDEWNLQANLANAELTQIASEIIAAQDRLTVAQTELSIQNQQIANAQAVSDFLTNKYTNAQLYDWMITQLTTVYAQAYQLAFSMALQAQTAYQYELGRPLDQFIEFAYWDSQHKGLTAGESLIFDLRRMETQYLANNLRELELTKHISLALTQPLTLVQLLETGNCNIVLDETVFDFDHPGTYFRRLRSVALTIPCVTGPYTSVNATLTLGSSVLRTVAPSANYQPWLWANAASDNDPGISASPTVAATPVIATSSGQNDSGLFETNLRDERWLPFEGQGAVSTWNLTLDPRDNNFDLSSVTDVVLHLRYSARFGGNAEAVRTALKPANARSVLVSVRNTFGDAYYSFFNPTNTTSAVQTLTLPITSAIFPFSNLGSPTITDIAFYVMLSQVPAAGTAITGTFGSTGGATIPLSLTPAVGTTTAGKSVGAMSGDASLTTPLSPGSFTLTVPTVPAALGVAVSGQTRFDPSKIEDIVLIINYKVA